MFTHTHIHTRTHKPIPESAPEDPSPVVSVTVGPDVRRPVVLVVSSEAGRVYVKALSDFVFWEGIRSPTTFNKVVNAPINAVRNAIYGASQLGTGKRVIYIHIYILY